MGRRPRRLGSQDGIQVVTADRLTQTFAARAELSDSDLTKRLLALASQKESNLCVAVDETDPGKLLAIVEAVGPHIAVLKTHIDTIEGYTGKLATELANLARAHDFLIFEDRKFADIGQTVKNQYTKGIYHIIEWADIVNAHALPGPGIVAGLKDQVIEEGLAGKRGLLLLAQMSSAGNLFSAEYTEAVVKIAKANDDFVIGFIGAGVADLPRLAKVAPAHLLIFSPGVKFGVKPGAKGDDLGQRYSSPDDLMAAGTDFLIVGRDIWQADDPAAKASEYRTQGWDAYLRRVGGRATT